MSRIRLVAIDLDDTLLRDDLTISQRTQDVVRRVKEMGVAVTLATGRMFPAAKPYAEMLGFDLPLITYQGALVKNAFSGEVVYYRPLSEEVARRVIAFGREKGVQINYYLNDKLYVEKITPQGEHYSSLAGVPFSLVSDLEQLLKEGPPTKLLVIDEEPKIDSYLMELREIIDGEGLAAHLTKSKPLYLEVNHPEATKGVALRVLADQLKVKREEIMAFGDSFNDLDMLEFAGIGVAVANARPEVRRRAQYVTSSNNDDGVAEALERFVLGK